MARGKHSFPLLTACWETNSSVRSGEQVGKGEGKDLRKARMNQGERVTARAQRGTEKDAAGGHTSRVSEVLGRVAGLKSCGAGVWPHHSSPTTRPTGQMWADSVRSPCVLTSTTALSRPCAWPGCRIKVTECLHASMLPGWKFPKGAPESPTSTYSWSLDSDLLPAGLLDLPRCAPNSPKKMMGRRVRKRGRAGRKVIQGRQTWEEQSRFSLRWWAWTC